MLDLTRDKHGLTSIKNIRPIKINFFVSYPYWSPIRIENQNTNEIEEFPYELKDYDSRLNAIRRANELIKKNRHKLRKQGKYDELEKPIPEFCLEVIMDYGDTEPGRSIDKKAIDNEELFKLKDDDDFIPRFNRTMYEYSILKKESAQAEGRWDEKNIWYTPYRNFGDWFDKHPKYGDAKPYFNPVSGKINWKEPLWKLALKMRQKTDGGDFKTYMDAYRYAVRQYDSYGEPIKSPQKLVKAFENASGQMPKEIVDYLDD